MKAEKIQKEQVSRTIQPMRKGGGTAQFVDGRESATNRIHQDQPVQLVSEDDEESVQLKKDSSVTQQKPNNTGLPDSLKTGIENHSGFSMDDVRVHYNSSKPATVQALAYTQGTDIHVAPGQEQHLPHETWHVVQQMQGRVQPTTEIGGMPVNNDAGLEREADVMGRGVLQAKTRNKIAFSNIHSLAIQCTLEEEKRKRAYQIGERRHRNNPNYNNPLADYYDAEEELKQERAHQIWEKRRKGNPHYNNPLADYYDAEKELKKELEQERKVDQDIDWCFSILKISPTEKSKLKVELLTDPLSSQYIFAKGASGGYFDHNTSKILICSDSYNKRTLLHEIGHFKQFIYLGETNYNNLTKDFREAHNVIVNENREMLLTPPDESNLKDVYICIEKKYRRVGYTSVSYAKSCIRNEEEYAKLINKPMSEHIKKMITDMYTEIQNIPDDEKGYNLNGKEIHTKAASLSYLVTSMKQQLTLLA